MGRWLEGGVGERAEGDWGDRDSGVEREEGVLQQEVLVHNDPGKKGA